MVDACGNRLKGPPSIYSPYGKLCFTPAFSTWENTTFTPCVSSARTVHENRSGMDFKPARPFAKGADTLPADFTPVAVSTGPSRTYGVASNSKWACKNNLIETVVDGKRNVMCPVGVAQNISRNCTSTMKRVWQCDRFLAKGDLDGYNKCKQMEQCFQYDIKLPDGNHVPIAVKANDMCMAAASVALQQSAPQCVNGQRRVCTTRPTWG